MPDRLLEVTNLVKHFPIGGGLFKRSQTVVRAVDGVSFYLERGETLGLIGESGCGKTTTARMVVGLLEPTSGTIRFGGREAIHLRADERMEYRRNVQMIFQDPYESLNPRKTIGHIVGQPFEVHKISSGKATRERVIELIESVGLSPGIEYIDRYPHQFSGGQRQRIGIARPLALNPKLVVADEPVSALDISVRAQVLNLLKDLQQRLGLSYLFITHDLGVARSLCDRIAVMYLGEIVEESATESLFRRPLHPYTAALLSATPISNPRKARARQRILLSGEVPSPVNPPSGCRFRTRCPFAEERCAAETPQLAPYGDGRRVACHFVERIQATRALSPLGV